MFFNKLMELNKWNQVNGTAYMFSEGPPMGKGTFAYVRGSVESLSNFVYNLNKSYNGERIAKDDRFKHDEILRTVLESGERRSVEPIISFGSDRIRLIRRMDDIDIGVPPKEGPFWGSKEHLEIQHHEQSGGHWRNDLIDKVLNSLE